MIELDDCGNVKVIMVIKAPRGTIALFVYSPHRQWQYPTNSYLNRQHMAIKAFMKEHGND